MEFRKYIKLGKDLTEPTVSWIVWKSYFFEAIKLFFWHLLDGISRTY